MNDLRTGFISRLPRMAAADGASEEWAAYLSDIGGAEDEEGDIARILPSEAAAPDEGDGAIGLLLEDLPETTEVEQEHERNKELFLLDLDPPGKGGRGDPETVRIAVSAGETLFEIFDAEGRCERRCAVDSGWAAACRYPVSLRGRIVRLTRTEELAAAVAGVLRVHGDPVEAPDVGEFLGGHVRRVVAFGLAHSVGTALGYREVVVEGPGWLAPVLDGVLSLLPHIRVEEKDG